MFIRGMFRFIRPAKAPCALVLMDPPYNQDLAPPALAALQTAGWLTPGALAAVVTLVFYVAVVTPLSGSYFADLFGERGWVPYGITWLSAWAGVLLVIKAQLLGGQLTVDSRSRHHVCAVPQRRDASCAGDLAQSRTAARGTPAHPSEPGSRARTWQWNRRTRGLPGRTTARSHQARRIVSRESIVRAH